MNNDLIDAVDLKEIAAACCSTSIMAGREQQCKRCYNGLLLGICPVRYVFFGLLKAAWSIFYTYFELKTSLPKQRGFC